MNKDILFRSDISRGGRILVKRHEEVIEGFSVVTKGVTHDERGEFDDDALEKIVELGNKSKIGVKSRFGHPNMSNTALGTFLGRTKNFRRDGKIVRADLQIDETAHKTPDGDLAAYVMDLAESDPAAFGSSMVIHWDEEYRKEKDGTLTKNEKGELLPPLIRVKKLLSVDIVDDPAANEGLFGESFFSGAVKPSAEMTNFLDRFLAEPDAVTKVMSFLERYKFNHDEGEKQKIEKGAKAMYEELTVEVLKKEKPEVFNAVTKSGSDEGQKLERERVTAILKVAGNFKDMNTLALEAIEKGLSLDKALITFQKKQLEGIEAAQAAGPGPDHDPEKGKKKLSHLERAKAYQEEHKCTMTRALSATAEKRK